MYAALGEDDACFGGVLDGILALAVLTSNAADRAREVVALEDLHVGHLEGVHEEVLDTKQGDRVGDVEAQKVCTHKVGGLLQRVDVVGVLRRLDLHATVARVHPHVQLQVLHDRRIDLHPLLAQRRVAMRRHWDAAKLALPAARLLGCHRGKLGLLDRSAAAAALPLARGGLLFIHLLLTCIVILSSGNLHGALLEDFGFDLPH